MALNANFIADFSSFMEATKEAIGAMTEFKGEAGTLGPTVDKGLEETARKYMELGAKARAVGAEIVAAAGPFIQAFTEEQDAVNRLTTALEANGMKTPEMIAAYGALATQFQDTTKYADEAILGVEAILTSIGEVGPDQMELALTAVTNLASAMKIDLETAATMVAKAFESGGEHLGKLKTLLGEAYVEGMTTTEMLEAINDKFGPAAQAELETYTGKIANMKNQMSDFNEQVGGVLVDMLTRILDAFKQLPEPVQTFTIGVVAIGTALAPVLISLSSLVTILTTTGLGAGIVTAITTIIGLLTGPVGWVVAIGTLVGVVYASWDKIVEYTKWMYEGIKGYLVDKFGALVAMIQEKIGAVVGAFQSMYNVLIGHSIIPDTIDGIQQQFSRMDEVMVRPVADATAQVQAHLQLMAAQMRANAILKENSLFTTSGQLERIAQVFDASVAGTGGGRGSAGTAAPVTVNNTFNLVDTESNLAHKISDIIMRQIRSGTQLGTA